MECLVWCPLSRSSPRQNALEVTKTEVVQQQRGHVRARSCQRCLVEVVISPSICSSEGLLKIQMQTIHVLDRHLPASFEQANRLLSLTRVNTEWCTHSSFKTSGAGMKELNYLKRVDLVSHTVSTEYPKGLSTATRWITTLVTPSLLLMERFTLDPMELESIVGRGQLAPKGERHSKMLVL